MPRLSPRGVLGAACCLLPCLAAAGCGPTPGAGSAASAGPVSGSGLVTAFSAVGVETAHEDGAVRRESTPEENDRRAEEYQRQMSRAEFLDGPAEPPADVPPGHAPADRPRPAG